MNKIDRFDTLTAFMNAVDALPGVGPGPDPWAGGSYVESRDLALYGWPEGARRASEMATSIADRIVNACPVDGPNYSYDVSGAAFDMGALMQGVPESWSLVQQTGTRKEVRIAINTSISAGIDKEVMIRRGVAVAALAVALQSRGYSVTIDVGGIGWNGERQVWIRVADAATGSQLDLDRVVYAVAHPTFFRLMIHHWFAGRKDGYGSHMPTDEQHPDADIYLGCTHLYQVERWRDGGENWIIQQYLEQTKEN